MQCESHLTVFTVIHDSIAVSFSQVCLFVTCTVLDYLLSECIIISLLCHRKVTRAVPVQLFFRGKTMRPLSSPASVYSPRLLLKHSYTEMLPIPHCCPSASNTLTFGRYTVLYMV